ncbi:DUF2157 domain-containing protein, partial [Candidatus Dojkabacteria bacterium]|nr:DUF2157 domain-containing protein [Candidatus Dojkabacteria bacterium]
MEDLFTCLSPFICMFLILGLIFLFVRDSIKSKQTNILDKTLLIKWLKSMQSKGYDTIEELIKFLEPPLEKGIPIKEEIVEPKTEMAVNSNTEENIIREQPEEKTVEYEREQTKIEPPVKEDKPDQLEIIKDQLSNANFLLYLGSGLVLFAIFIFVAFNWQSFTPFIKSLILVLLTSAFYISGLITSNYKNLKQASGTFYFIGSICLGLGGIGLWNFNQVLFQSNNIQFSTYWLFYSILLIIVYIASYYYLKNKNYIYLTIISLYSIIASLAYTLTNDDKYRIIVIAVLNLFVFLLHSYTKDMNRMISLSSRTINYVLDFVIFFLLISLQDEIITSTDKIIGLTVLFIPSIFYVLSYYKLKLNIDLHILALTIPLKILQVISIYQLGVAEGLFFYSLLLITYSSCKHICRIPKLDLTLEFVKWTISMILILIAINLGTLYPSEIIFVNSALLLTSLNLIIPYFIAKDPKILALGLISIIPTVFQIYFNSIKTPGSSYLEQANLISIVLLLLAILANVYFSKYIKGVFKFIIIPFLIITSLLVFVTSLDGNIERYFVSLALLVISGFILKLIYTQITDKYENWFYYLGIISSNLISILILLSALFSTGTLDSQDLQVKATIAIAVLPLLNLIKIFEGKYSKEAFITLLLIPIQLLVICLLNRFSFEDTIIVFTLYSIIKVIASEIYNKKGQQQLHMLSQIIFWIILVFTTFFTTSVVIEEFNLPFSKLTIVFVYLVNLVLFNLPAILFKRKEVLTITINYLLLTIFRFLGIVVNEDNTLAYLVTAVITHIAGVSAYFYSNKLEKKDITFLPFIILSALALVLSIVGSSDLYQFLGFSVLAITTFIIANFHSKDEIKYLTVTSLFFATNFFIGYLFEVTKSFELITYSLLNTLLILPAVLYMFNFELNYEKGKILKSNILGIIIFSIYAIFITVDYYKILVLAILLIYNTYLLVKHNFKFAPYLIFILSNFIFIHFGNIEEFTYEKIVTGISAISFLFCFPAIFKSINYPKVFNFLGSAILITLTIINIPYIFVANTLTNYTIMTSLFATAGLAISDKYSMWLGN